ncbi:P-loop containing nucleoside triphosphate hydrolase protein [Talaromyces proteolyticus]|uniref:P-loop containing nucleoside triphosphate hydrolase protein n=1 Tax=Talaromyces proteolyticus TaxID=1131652 RepID=A0AAD4KXA8_9EURO|nr:P-loop containing nucleoside triphosphate hydrolase protein [Talaromyces proteolyticus]KAH8698887.1 P-loop containing nucleoside triphosphate hydrolase protein [Talaromyces proteolyticus]
MDRLNTPQLESLQSKDQAALLDTVDEIRRHGVNRYISLPQLIVCGDQSSGKSSVLEAISGVHFPVNDGLCTRFTTEVILRRASEDLASVKLIPAKGASAEHRNKLSQFQRSSISHEEIPTLISEAKAIMGLTGSSTFSRDILQLEVSGPRLPHLTLVDLPGLIHHHNKEQTQEDVQIPIDLVRKYMSQPRSIVLAIVTAKNDTSNQIVLRMAKQYDPQGVRTMGIITKPDCLIKDSPNESAFFTLANNKETYFKLDWHILRNGDFNERKDSEFNRDKAEHEFLASGIWKNLPSSKRGVNSLRKRLSHVLYQQIQKELPSLLKEIELELTACKTVLDRLGASRDTQSSRRQYLTGMATRFHDLVKAGNEGTYQDLFFKIEDLASLRPSKSGQDELEQFNNRLRAILRQKEQSFSDKMHESGHTYQIVNERFQSNLEGPKYISETYFLNEIRVLLDQSKGKELPGTFTPLLVGDLFLRQSMNWKSIAMEFAEDMWNIVKKFLDNVLTEVADENVRHAILDEIIDPAMDGVLLKLKEKVTELHSPYSKSYPATLNPRFVQELEKKRSQKLLGSSSAPTREDNNEHSSIYACRELLYLMQAYYAVAIEVFIDNIAILAIENCLMAELEGLLSPLTVSGMDDGMLEAIAFESEDVRELRSQTLDKQFSLQKSYELCRRQARKLASNRLNADSESTGSTIEPVKEEVSVVSTNAPVSKESPVPNPSNGTGAYKTTSRSVLQDKKPDFLTSGTTVQSSPDKTSSSAAHLGKPQITRDVTVTSLFEGTAALSHDSSGSIPKSPFANPVSPPTATGLFGSKLSPASQGLGNSNIFSEQVQSTGTSGTLSAGGIFVGGESVGGEFGGGVGSRPGGLFGNPPKTPAATTTPAKTTPSLFSNSQDPEESSKKGINFSYFNSIPNSFDVSSDKLVKQDKDFTSGGTNNWVHISRADDYHQFQPEEIRLKDYYYRDSTKN